MSRSRTAPPSNMILLTARLASQVMKSTTALCGVPRAMCRAHDLKVEADKYHYQTN